MPLVKISANDLNQPKLIAAKDFKSFIEKAQTKLGFKIDKVVRQSDGSEIDDEDVFEELLNEKTELWLICLRDGDEYPLVKQESPETASKEVPTSFNSEIKTKTTESPIVENINSDVSIAARADDESPKINKEDNLESFETSISDSEVENVKLLNENDMKDLYGADMKEAKELKKDVNNKPKEEDQPDSNEPNALKTMIESLTKELDREKPGLIKSILKSMTKADAVIEAEEDPKIVKSLIKTLTIGEETPKDFLEKTLHNLMNNNIEAEAVRRSPELVKTMFETLAIGVDAEKPGLLKTIIKSMTKSNDIPILIEDNKDANLMKTVETLMKNTQSNKDSNSEMKLVTELNLNGEKLTFVLSNQIDFPEKKNLINEQIGLKIDPNQDLNAPIETKQSPKTLFAEIIKAEKVDVCFLVDCTGSMKPYIDMVKSTLNNIVDKLKTKFKSFEMRVSFVGYRDHADKEYRITCLPFTENIEVFKSFVSDLKAGGGADQCEVK